MQGKTWLIAVYCVIRCILFPGSKIVVAAGLKSQAQEVLVYVDTMRKNNSNLDREIESCKPTSSTDPTCHFHNKSWIRVVAATDGARSKRANILIVDEFRMVKMDIVNKTLRKFLTAPRQPKYLDKPEYKHLAERNKEYYLSSCWYKSHWSWEKVKTFFKKIVGTSDTENGEAKINPYFLCALPYQLAISENLYMKEQAIDEMSEADFDSNGWDMEMGCHFFGEAERAYFKFDDIEENRVLPKVDYPTEVYNEINIKTFKKSTKKLGIIRYVSIDIALMATTKSKINDASAFSIFELIPRKHGYERKVIYMESLMGGHTNIQSVRIMQLFEDYNCDYIVLDCQGVGMGIYDQLCQGVLDRNTNKEYEPLSCMNDVDMADRCVDSNAKKIIYSVKATSKFNSDIAKSLKDDLKQNKLKLLMGENDAKVTLMGIKGYNMLPIEKQAQLLNPYIQITLLLNEMLNLENISPDPSIIRLKEPRNGRKDKYCSVAYGNYFATVLEREYLRRDIQSDIGSYNFW